MSFTLDVVINPVILCGAVIFGGVLGFILFRSQLNKGKAKIRQLEDDLMVSNEETLEAQRAYVILENKLQDQQPSPVIPMKIKDNSKEKTSNK